MESILGHRFGNVCPLREKLISQMEGNAVAVGSDRRSNVAGHEERPRPDSGIDHRIDHGHEAERVSLLIRLARRGIELELRQSVEKGTGLATRRTEEVRMLVSELL